MQAAIYTLGCKVNQYETQAMEQELVRRGHTLVPFDQKADVYIVNTCSVTAVSDKKSRQMIRRCRKLNPNAVVAACGCYVQTHAEEAAGLDVDLIAGTGDRMAFLDLLEQVGREKQVTLLADALRRREFEVLPAGGMAERTRAMLKVEDGCVNFCTYCIIPYARGPVRSLPKAEAVAQTEHLRQEGYRELVFTGIEISSWGRDLKTGRASSTFWRRCPPPQGICGCGWAVWSPVPSRRTSAAVPPRCPICVPTFICLCSPAVTPR